MRIYNDAVIFLGISEFHLYCKLWGYIISHRIHVWYFAYIHHKNQPNVGKYTIHGSHGYTVSKSLLSFLKCVVFFLETSNKHGLLRIHLSWNLTNRYPTWRQNLKPAEQGALSICAMNFGSGKNQIFPEPKSRYTLAVAKMLQGGPLLVISRGLYIYIIIYIYIIYT